jgi:hypothetical protein
MIWNAKAVNHSSKCNPGSQPVWFEKSLLFGQRIGIPNNCVLAQTRESRTVSAGQVPKCQRQDDRFGVD